jgi:hypothetical protein
MADAFFLCGSIVKNVPMVVPQGPPFPDPLEEASSAVGPFRNGDTALAKGRPHIRKAHVPLPQREAH